MSFRFVHIADVHLDTPFQSRDAYLREELGDYLKEAFSSAIDLAIDKNAHAFLIAGDLFDDDMLSYATAKFLSDEMERLGEKDIHVFYTPGNHDPSMGGTKSSAIKWQDHVHVFSAAEPEVVPILGKDKEAIAYIVGAGHERRMEERNLAKKFPHAREDAPCIGILHCLMLDGQNIGNHGRYAPCTRIDLEEKGYVYWALGHIHKRATYTGNTDIVYPGNISGRNFREKGLKGAYYVEVDRGGTVNMQFVPLSKVLWVDIDIENLEDIEDWVTLEGFIQAQLAKELDKSLTSAYKIEMIIARANLKGRSPMHKYLLDEENIEALEQEVGTALAIDRLKIESDLLYPPIDISEYKDAPHLVGYVLDLIERAREDEQLLLSLAPEPIAGRKARGHGQDEILKYLRGLLDDMEYEALSRLIEEDDI